MNVALAIITSGQKILICKIKPEKKSEYGGLDYVFPCESINKLDNIELELVNEVKRQFDLDAKVINLIGERKHPATKNQTFYYHCEITSDDNMTATEDTDFESFIWTNIDELENYMPTLFDGVRKFLKSIE